MPGDDNNNSNSNRKRAEKAGSRTPTAKRAKNKKNSNSSSKKKAPTAEVVDFDEYGNPIYKVEKLVDARKNQNGEWEYRVRWENYGPEDDTWEPEASVIADDFDSPLADEARRLRMTKENDLEKNVIDLFSNSSSSDTESMVIEEQRQGEVGGVLEVASSCETEEVQVINDMLLHRSTDATSNYSDSDGNSASKQQQQQQPKIKRKRTTDAAWNDRAQVNFREVQRIHVHDEDARQRIREAREYGIPICLTGHKGWAQFAKRWLSLKSKPEQEGTTVSEPVTTLPIQPDTQQLADTNQFSGATSLADTQSVGPSPSVVLDGELSSSPSGGGGGGVQHVTQRLPDTNQLSGVSTLDMTQTYGTSPSVVLDRGLSSSGAGGGDGAQQVTQRLSDSTQHSALSSLATTQSYGASPSVVLDRGLSSSSGGGGGTISLSDASDNRSPASTNQVTPAAPFVTMQVSDFSKQQDQILIPKNNNNDGAALEEKEDWLDLTLDWQVDVQQMSQDIGMEYVPILKKGYNEYNPIQRKIPCAEFLKRCWPSPDTTITKNIQRLYLHQWQFPCTDIKSKLCGDKCHNPLPYNILGEDLLASAQDDKINMFQYIFMGREETISKIHQDLGGLDITIAPIVGEKEATMVHRSDGVCISHLEANLDKINLHQDPLLPHARIYRTIVRPGEILLMPQGTYHGCRNITPCLSYSRFILDEVNLRAFVESMWDGDAPEIAHQQVIWNASCDLYRKVDAYLESLEKLKKEQRKSSIDPETVQPSAEMMPTVQALSALRNVCRAISLRLEKGFILPSPEDDEEDGKAFSLEDWYRMLEDIDSTLHDFRYRNSSSKPKFRFRGTSGNTPANTLSDYLKTPLESALERLPLVVESVDCMPRNLNLVVEDKVEASFQGRRVMGVIKRIEWAKQTAFLQFEGLPLVYNEFHPFEALRASVAGEACTEIPPCNVKPGKVVVLPSNKQQYRAVVKSCLQEDLFLLHMTIGETTYERWIPRSYILNTTS